MGDSSAWAQKLSTPYPMPFASLRETTSNPTHGHPIWKTRSPTRLGRVQDLLITPSHYRCYVNLNITLSEHRPTVT